MEETGAPEAVLDGDDIVVLSVRLPPVPALTLGDSLVSAPADAFLKAARVLGPVVLVDISELSTMETWDYRLRWVDHTNHAILAVLSLCAVEPYRC